MVAAVGVAVVEAQRGGEQLGLLILKACWQTPMHCVGLNVLDLCQLVNFQPRLLSISITMCNVQHR